jgi:hypothetical protein
MANLWQFFGLPDPDVQTKPVKKEVKPVIKESKTPIPKQEVKETTITWRGAITPDGDKFHDLAESTWGKQTEVRQNLRGLRYITPDEKHRLPIDGMEQRLSEGDILIVDLRNLVHMDAHQNACRRMLRELSDSLALPAFTLDEEEKILLLPGAGITIDISNHSLGLTPVIS